MSLPHNFLIEMARKYKLSPEQEETFVQLFGTDKSRVKICQELRIKDSSFSSRMTEAYKKFSISGSGPVKQRELLNFLDTEYQKSRRSSSPTDWSEQELNDLVQEVREKCRDMIQDQCGTMRSLTMSQPIDVTDLYTNVNILEKIPSRQWREVDEIVEDFTLENFDRLGCGKISDRGIPGLEAVEKYPKLMVLGKPGSGKTTFLKHLAIQCNTGKFQNFRVPVFITLKEFAEAEGQPSLQEYITQMLSGCDVSAEQIVVLLKKGKTLVLLDGLDEVKVEDNSRIIKQVRDFSDKFRSNQFVMTCRIAASNYNFEKFTDVEVADFDDGQIKTFVQKWFKANEPAKSNKFIEKLHENAPIRELATNPLLLTLLCLVFEKGDKFSVNRSELYEEGVNLLIKRWDESRQIEREQVYKNLSAQCKKDLLSQIALTTFERGNYFFKQKELEQYISDYMRRVPNSQNEPKVLQLESEAVLKSIEVQHGLLVERAQKIYSFSHLTFQEYFTARYYVGNINAKILKKLIINLTETRWREVFLLTAKMLPNADKLLLLMKQQTDSIIASDYKLMEFMKWVNHKSLSVKASHKPAAVRDYYFNESRFIKRTLGLEPTLNINFVSTSSISPSFDSLFNFITPELIIDGMLYGSLIYASTINFEYGNKRANEIACNLIFLLKTALRGTVNIELNEALQELIEPVPNPENAKEKFKEWWETEGNFWINELRKLLIIHCNIGHCWHFTEQQRNLLEQYYTATKLLVESLKSRCAVSDRVREGIEEALLLVNS